MKKILQTFLSVLFLYVGSSIASAQEIHYSIFNNQNLSYSSSFTSLDKKVSTSYQQRLQWSSVSSEVRTSNIGFIFPFKVTKARTTSPAGVGSYLEIHDVGNGRYKQNEFHLCGSYNLPLGTDGVHNLIFGLDAGYSSLTLSSADLYTGAQYQDGSGFNSFLGNNVVGQDGKTSYLDLSFAVHYANKLNFDPSSDKSRFFLGFNINHLNAPNVSFGPRDFRYSPVFSGYLGFETGISKKVFLETNVRVDAYYESTVVAGIFAKYLLNLESDATLIPQIKVGAYYRHPGSIIAQIGMDISRFSIALSYDYETAAYLEKLNSWEFSIAAFFNRSEKTATPPDRGGARYKGDL